MCWAVLDALNNNNIQWGDNVGEGNPAESTYHIKVKGAVRVYSYTVKINYLF